MCVYGAGPICFVPLTERSAVGKDAANLVLDSPKGPRMSEGLCSLSFCSCFCFSSFNVYLFVPVKQFEQFLCVKSETKIRPAELFIAAAYL